MSNSGSCRCGHHHAFPVLLVLIGLAFLLSNLDIISSHTLNLLWPTLLIIIGLTKVFGRNCKCCCAPKEGCSDNKESNNNGCCR